MPRIFIPFMFVIGSLTLPPGQIACAQATPKAAPQVKDLRECYLQVAMHKATADMAYMARELCDAVFKPPRQSLVVLEPKNGMCTEWWLDRLGRYETAQIYCVFSGDSGNKMNLACQYKDKGAHYAFVELQERGDRYEPIGKVQGDSPGHLFKSMAACIQHKAK
ncbi:MAG: hypothetical protein R3C68_08480 [Myxococcota bacterium]